MSRYNPAEEAAILRALTITDDDVDFDAYLEPRERSKLRDASTYRDEAHAELLRAEKARGLVLPWTKATEFHFRDSELTVWTGYNGHKKSMLLGFVALSLIAQGQKCCIASLEMPALRTLKRMCRQLTGMAEPQAPDVDYFFDWCEERLWLYDQVGTVKPDRMLAIARYATQELGVSHFVIDSLMKCGISVEDLDRQKAFVDGLAAVAKDTKAHIHLVAHARKPDGGKEGMPSTKYGVKGASEITDIADNVLVVFSPRDGGAGYDTGLICEKQRNGEAEPSTRLFFDMVSLQFKPEANSARLTREDWNQKSWR